MKLKWVLSLKATCGLLGPHLDEFLDHKTTVPIDLSVELTHNRADSSDINTNMFSFLLRTPGFNPNTSCQLYFSFLFQ
ncbi:LOW QUALITY PROTEIN: hypothetical protein PanWU01x14_168030 [Parasponia andersonii]|uniref:Uncharacterized protein n=1 Tax=Parasponia andersonii TaxID=3476 RepID=A0A2P5CB33_PARAD|nr:LOW QUALITY PROTEIN: hypothetical protein PanWU01x14_168030 [Parasponia andersonii]